MIDACPLQWPAGWPRTESAWRTTARFNKATSTVHRWSDGNSLTWRGKKELSVSDGVSRVLAELQRFGVDRQDVVISTNVRTRLDGMPRSGEREPTDPGAAVYWTDAAGSQPRVIAIDRYTAVADNLAAIAATLDAMRAIERHGGAQILERAFTGFTALPAPAPNAKRDWQAVLGLQDLLQPTMEDVKTAYRRLASQRHPDRGGTHEAMTELNQALADAEKELQ